MPSAPFRLNRSGIMLAIVSAAFATEASAAAGRAEFIIGGVTVARGGVERPLTRGTELDNGDVVRTNNGRAQIRFTDGAYVSLQPNTEFGIREYRYDNRADGNERGFFGLLKGAMRTVTGAIGRINRDRYQIATPTATVGIRGTGGVIQVQDDGSTLVVGTSGIWSLTNPAGSVDVPAGNSAVAPSDPNQPPQETTQQPSSGPAPVPEEPQFVAGEERTEDGLPIIPTPSFTPLVSGSGYATAVAFGQDTGQTFFFGRVESGENVDAVFNGLGQLTSMSFPGFDNILQFSLDSGEQVDFGSDGTLAWGRWIGSATVTSQVCDVTCPPANETYLANQGLHYVIGMPTPTLPTSGPATFTLLGATRPTYAEGTTSPGTFTGTLAVNFAGTATIDANFTITMPDRVYGLSGRTTTDTALFQLFPNPTGCESSTCSGRIDGFFAGANAERAGVGYHINDTQSVSKNIVGAAAFQR